MIQTTELYRLYLEHPEIVTDSRNVVPGCLFFGLKGDHFDGSLFAAEALDKGAAAAIVDNPLLPANEQTILVPDTLAALQKLAVHHRSRIKAVVIGITGSNGKTTTKELIGQALASSFKTQTTRGNLNNHIGVPLTILGIKPDTEYAVIEMGANHQGEIAALCQIARPGFGLITNIGKAHLEGFGGFEGVVRAKSELYRYIKENNGTVFINADNPLLVELAENQTQVRYGSGESAQCRGRLVRTEPTLSVEWDWHELSGKIETSLYGDYNFENILAAVCIGLHFKANTAGINRAIAGYVPSNNRSQWVLTRNNEVLLDAYNANPSSMKAAILNFSRMKTRQHVLILGDMMELGEYSGQEHRELVELCRTLDLDRVMLIGEQFCRAAADGNEICLQNLEEAMEYLRREPVKDARVLLKASRKMQLEQLIPLF